MAGKASTNEITGLLLSCRGINLNGIRPTVNSEIAFDVREELARHTNYFDATNTVLTGSIVVDAAERTFGFEVTVKLKRPYKF